MAPWGHRVEGQLRLRGQDLSPGDLAALAKVRAPSCAGLAGSMQSVADMCGLPEVHVTKSGQVVAGWCVRQPPAARLLVLAALPGMSFAVVLLLTHGP